jgi:hypothetical protein
MVMLVTFIFCLVDPGSLPVPRNPSWQDNLLMMGTQSPWPMAGNIWAFYQIWIWFHGMDLFFPCLNYLCIALDCYRHDMVYLQLVWLFIVKPFKLVFGLCLIMPLTLLWILCYVLWIPVLYCILQLVLCHSLYLLWLCYCECSLVVTQMVLPYYTLLQYKRTYTLASICFNLSFTHQLAHAPTPYQWSPIYIQLRLEQSFDCTHLCRASGKWKFGSN